MSVINSFPLLLPSASWVLAVPSNPGLLADPPPSQTGSHTVTACEEHCQAQHSIFLFVSRLTETLEHKQGLSFVHGPVFSIQNNAWQWQLLSYACQSLQEEPFPLPPFSEIWLGPSRQTVCLSFHSQQFYSFHGTHRVLLCIISEQIKSSTGL